MRRFDVALISDDGLRMVLTIAAKDEQAAERRAPEVAGTLSKASGGRYTIVEVAPT